MDSDQRLQTFKIKGSKVKVKVLHNVLTSKNVTFHERILLEFKLC